MMLGRTVKDVDSETYYAEIVSVEPGGCNFAMSSDACASQEEAQRALPALRAEFDLWLMGIDECDGVGLAD